MNHDLEDILGEFVEESRDIIVRLRSLLYETKEDDIVSILSEFFRGVHTIKGGSAMLELKVLTERAHALETELGKLRDGIVSPSSRLGDELQFELDVFERALDAAPEEPSERFPESNVSSNLDHDEQSQMDTKEVKSTQVSSSNSPLSKTKDESKSKARTRQAQVEFLRVPLPLVTGALNQIWELFLVRNQLSALFDSNRDMLRKHSDLWQTWEQIDSALRRNVTELESSVMAMRMASMKGLFARMEATARQYEREHPEKKFSFVLDGRDVEADKKVLDALGEPLVHLVRNSLDHGIESSKQRLDAGKEAQGEVRLSATLGTDNLFIRVQDNGGGIDANRIVQHAQSRGIDVSKIESDEDAYELMFAPGFSTAPEVTETSGRGVGLDAVRRSVVELGGSVEIESELGKGTTFTIILPLSLSVIDAILFDVNGHRLGCSVGPVVEVLKVEQDALDTSRGSTSIRYRGHYFPCVDLTEEFHAYEGMPSSPQVEDDLEWVIMTETRKGLVGFRVSGVRENTEIIVKPMPRYGPRPRFVSGVSLLPTGEPFFVVTLDRMVDMSQKQGRVEAA